MSNEKLNISQRDLIIRIDERVKSMDDRLKGVESNLVPPTEHQLLLDTVAVCGTRLSSLEKWQSRVIGFGAAAGAIAAIILNFLQELFFQKGA